MRHWTAVLLAVAGLGAGCSRQRADGSDAPPPTRAEVWNAIQAPAQRYGMDPAFIYAVVAAESNFNPRARRGAARGLMQLTPGAWRSVSSEPYEPAVWDWRRNLEAGIDYLAYIRSYLHRHTTFTYPKLLAAFHYGLDYLEDRKFDPGRIAVPDNPVYQELWRGNLRPVPPPSSSAAP